MRGGLFKWELFIREKSNDLRHKETVSTMIKFQLCSSCLPGSKCLFLWIFLLHQRHLVAEKRKISWQVQLLTEIQEKRWANHPIQQSREKGNHFSSCFCHSQNMVLGKEKRVGWMGVQVTRGNGNERVLRDTGIWAWSIKQLNWTLWQVRLNLTQFLFFHRPWNCQHKTWLEI